MSTYTPDKWLLIQMGGIKKVLGSWSGGYLDSDIWRISSDVVNIIEKDDHYLIENHSGSIYKCYKGSEGTTMASADILDQIIEICNEERVTMTIIEDITGE